jgi:hypothetical protein
MKQLVFSIIAAVFMTMSVNAATTTNQISSQSKTFVKAITKDKATYNVTYNIKENVGWCWVEWTVTITWSDGTTSSYSGTTGSASGCGAAVQSALGTIGQILDVVLP